MSQIPNLSTASRFSADRFNSPQGRTRRLVTSVLAASVSLAGCYGPEESIAQQLADKFRQNFDPDTYTYFADDAYNIANGRDKDPNSTVQCNGQDSPTMTADQLVHYLANCNSRQRILEFFMKHRLSQSAGNGPAPATVEERTARSAQLQAARSIKVDDINIDPQLFQIYALLGKDPELYSAFMDTVITYRGWDLSDQDTFRHPIDSLRSGWADCDDWAVEHYFWTHLHRSSANLVIAVRPVNTGKIEGNYDVLNAHTVIKDWQVVPSQTTILDNQSTRPLKQGETMQGYFDTEFPGWDLTVQFDAPPPSANQ